MNACPCGYYGDSQKHCTCVAPVVTKYQNCISGPLLDRIDIHIEAPHVDCEKLSRDRLGEASDSIRARVQAAQYSTQTILEDRIVEYRLQRGYAYWGNSEVLQIARGRSKLDAFHNEPAEFISAGA